MYIDLLYRDLELTASVSGLTMHAISKLKNDIDTLLEAENKIVALQNIVPEFTRKNQL